MTLSKTTILRRAEILRKPLFFFPRMSALFNPAFTSAAGFVPDPLAAHRTAIAVQKSFKEGPHSTCFFVGRAPPRSGPAAQLHRAPEYTNRGTYSGSWSGNMRDGMGTQTLPDGSRYEGSWSLGKREGQGSLFVRRGGGLSLEYSGSWVAGRKQGFGKQAYANGNVCVAATAPGCPCFCFFAHAPPLHTHTHTQCSYEGAFENGLRQGQGQQVYADGSVYRGEWVRDVRQGVGELQLPSGDLYRGAWEGDEKHGEGSYVFAAKGRVLHGEWVRGLACAGEMTSHEGEGVSIGAPLPELGLANAACVSFPFVLFFLRGSIHL